MWICIVLIDLTFLPALATHLLPMFAAYLWISLTLFGLMLVGTWVYGKTLGPRTAKKRGSWGSLAVLMVGELVMFTMGTAIIQSSLNYGVLLYSGKFSYIDVVAHEFSMCNSACYLDYFNQQIHTFISFMSYLV